MPRFPQTHIREYEINQQVAERDSLRFRRRNLPGGGAYHVRESEINQRHEGLSTRDYLILEILSTVFLDVLFDFFSRRR